MKTQRQPGKKLTLSKQSIRVLNTTVPSAAAKGPTAIDCSITC